MAYIISQIFVCLSYALLGITYFLKNRKFILCFSLLAVCCNGLAFFFLKAWSGLAMSAFAILRNVVFLIQNRNGKSDKIKAIDWVILTGLVAVSVVSAVFTYDGIGSMLSVVATLTYTVSIWQKNPLVYKILGLAASILWIAYGIYILSIFSIILESVLLIAELVGIIRHKLKEKQQVKTQNEQNAGV